MKKQKEQAMQEFVNKLSEQHRKERAESQMTLGGLISALEELPQDKEIENICQPHSYRGYYEDLALEIHAGARTVKSLLDDLKKNCLDRSFYGWKGGEFLMNENTPMWIAKDGCCGVKIMGIERGDIFSFLTEGEDDPW
jgi:hypothetical protein